MKKGIAIVIASLFVVAAQAASFNWVADWVYSNQGQYDGVEPVTGSAWLVLVGGAAGDISVDNTGAITLGAGNTLVDSGTINNWIYSDSVNLAAATYNGLTFVMVGYDSVNQMYGVSGAYVMSGLSDIPAPNSVGHIFSNDGEGYLNLNTVATPEPTSMALLAFGVAVVGLRRRFRK